MYVFEFVVKIALDKIIYIIYLGPIEMRKKLDNYAYSKKPNKNKYYGKYILRTIISPTDH